MLQENTIVTPGWISRLLWHLTSQKKVGIIEPISNAVDNKTFSNIDYVDVNIEKINAIAARHAMNNFRKSFEINELTFSCFMMSKKLYFEIIVKDKTYQPSIFPYSLKNWVHGKGLKLICAEDVFVNQIHYD